MVQLEIVWGAADVALRGFHGVAGVDTSIGSLERQTADSMQAMQLIERCWRAGVHLEPPGAGSWDAHLLPLTAI